MCFTLCANLVQQTVQRTTHAAFKTPVVHHSCACMCCQYHQVDCSVQTQGICYGGSCGGDDGWCGSCRRTEVAVRYQSRTLWQWQRDDVEVVVVMGCV